MGDAIFSFLREIVRALRKTSRALLVLVAVLVVIRLALPLAVKSYVNRTLDKIPGYDGRLDDIDIHLWRGAYEIIGLRIVKTGGRVPVPFFSVTSADLSIQWRELFHGALVGKIILNEPRLNFVGSADKEKTQVSIDESWQDRVQELFPVKINYFEVRDGAIHFENFEAEPPIDISLDQVHMVAHNLSNSRRRRTPSNLLASLEADGVITQQGMFKLKTEFDPFSEQPRFKLAARLTKLELPALKDLTQHYAGLIVDRGRLNLYVECAASNGEFHGYVKPFTENLHIANFGNRELSFGQKLKGGIAELLAKIFKNREKGSVASKVEFAGQFDQPHVRTWAAIRFAFRHAFVQALAPRIENTIYREQLR